MNTYLAEKRKFNTLLKSHFNNYRSLTSIIFIILFFVFYFLFSASSAQAAAGSGTIYASSTTSRFASVQASSTGNWLEFTFKAAESMNTGEVDLYIPTGFSTPQGSISSGAGYTKVATSSASGSATSHVVLSLQAVSADKTTINVLDNPIGGGTLTLTEDDTDACNTTGTNPSIDGTVKTEGSASVKCGNAASTAPDDSDSLSYDYTGTADWSPYSFIGGWGRTTKSGGWTSTVSAELGWDDTATCASPLATVMNFGTVAASTWKFATTTVSRLTGITAIKAICWINFDSAGGGSAGGFISSDGNFDEVLVGATTTPWMVATSTGQDLRIRPMGMATNQQFTFSYGTSSGGFAAPGTPGRNVFIAATRPSSSVATTSMPNSSQPIVFVKGDVMLGDIGGGAQQETDKFTGAGSVSAAELFNFRLAANGETASTTLTINFTNTGGVAAGDFANTAIYVDSNCDSNIGGGETTQAFGTPAISGTTMAFTSTTTVTTGVTCYVLKSDVNNLAGGDTTTITLSDTGIVAYGNSSLSQEDPTDNGLRIHGSTTGATHTEDVAQPDLQQIRYRFRQDIVGENTNSAWLAAEDATSTTYRGGQTRVRIEVSNEGIGASTQTRFKLEYGIAKTGASGLGCVPVSAWSPVGNSGSTTPDWSMMPSSMLEDAASTTDFSGSLTNENTTFLAGVVKDTGNQTTGMNMGTANFTEHEFSLTLASSSVQKDTTYCLRLVNGTPGSSDPAFSYIRHPATVVALPTSVGGDTGSAPSGGEATPAGTPQGGGAIRGGGSGSSGSDSTPPGTPQGGGTQPGGGQGSGESGYIPPKNFLALIIRGVEYLIGTFNSSPY